MGWRGLIVLVAVGLVGAACSDTTEGSPATAPPTASTQAPLTTVAATTAPSTTAPATTAPPTTVDRVAEIEAIFRDLEFRRLDALYRGDEEAFRALFANEGYLEEGIRLGVLDIELDLEPTIDRIRYLEFTVLVDRPDCLAARIVQDLSALVPEAPPDPGNAQVLTPLDGRWGISYAGSGWLCDGPHPFDP